MYPNILRLSMFMRLREGQWTLLVSSCLRSTNRVNLRAREHADSQNIWMHPRIQSRVRHVRNKTKEINDSVLVTFDVDTNSANMTDPTLYTYLVAGGYFFALRF